MDMYDEDDKTIVTEEVFADVVCDDCDTPGARKFAGLAGHTHDFNPCPWCKSTQCQFNQQCGYVPTSFVLKDDSELLRQKFRSKDAGPQRQDDINNRYGVRFSAMDWIPGWTPSMQTPLDFMHCIFLGIVAYLWNHILGAAHMFGGIGGEDSPRQRLDRVMKSIQWPGCVSRVPKNVSSVTHCERFSCH